MKKGIHPTFYTDTTVACACGNTWITGSTKKVIHTEVCSRCHPFFTGQQSRMLDVEGQVDRFYKKLQARQSFVDQQKARETAKTSLERPLAELGLGTRPTDALTKAGLLSVGQVIDKLGEGESALLAVDGFGRKYLIDLKKKLRQFGYDLPAAAAEITV
jgi:large subunit ribosomal protein L31